MKRCFDFLKKCYSCNHRISKSNFGDGEGTKVWPIQKAIFGCFLYTTKLYRNLKIKWICDIALS